VLGHRPLDFQGAAHRIDSARKLDQGTVSRGLNDAAVMLRNFGVNQFTAMSLKRREGAFLSTPIRRL
jgi:hypothetical protein